MDTKEMILKIFIFGDKLVGKTCILKSYLEGEFIEINDGTFVLDDRRKKVKMEDGKTVTIQFWDTPGVDRFPNITKKFYKDSHGILLIYDVTSKYSFDNLEGRIESIKKEILKPIPIYLVGNKIDIAERRVITKEQGEEFAKNNGPPPFECTPKEIETVNLIFEKLIKNIYENLNPPKDIHKIKHKRKDCSIY